MTYESSIAFARRALAALCIVLGMGLPSGAGAETFTSDPNSTGWRLVDDRIEEVWWQRVATNCKPCESIAGHYNGTMSDLLRTRFELREIDRRELREAEQLKRRSAEAKEQDSGERALNIAAVIIGRGTDWGRLREVLNARARALEAQANWLRQALADCELQCKKQDTPKEANRIGTDPASGSPPRAAQPAELALGFDWRGPYPAVCFRCAKLADRLNELPAMARERLLDLSNLRSRLAELDAKIQMASFPYDDNYRENNSLRDFRERTRTRITELEGELQRIRDNFHATLRLYDDCVKKCPKQVGVCPMPPSNVAVAIGSRGDVGSGARMTQKLQETVGGMAGGALGGFLGRRSGGMLGGGGGGSREPDTARDPVDGDDKIKTRAQGVELAVGARFNGDGEMVVSSTIGEDAPGNGTFHAVFVQDAMGRRLVPYRLDIYEMWREWSLTVSWTYDRWVDGRHVERKEGGWVERGRDSKFFGVLTREQAKEASIWNRLGFANASHGVRSLGSTFKVTKKDLAGGPMNVVVHTTLPETDPVMTVPMVFEVALKPGDDDKLVMKPGTVAIAERGCPPNGVAPATSGGGPAGAVEAPAL